MAGPDNEKKNKSLTLVVAEVIEIILHFLVFLAVLVCNLVENIYKCIVPTSPKPVKGEIVLITGAGHGIGKELALQYASQGATVVGWDVNIKNNEETINEINQRGYSKAYAYYCDVSSRESVLEVARKVQEEVGEVTILVNNAGIMPTHLILDQTKEEIEKTFGINVLAHFWTLHAFLPGMRKNNYGHIVAISSCCGIMGMENLVPYCGSKFAVRGMMESLDHELRMEKFDGIHITIVCPFIVDTGLAKHPVIKFENIMPILKPRYVAEAVLHAQQTNQHMLVLPNYTFTLDLFLRFLPRKAYIYLRNSFGIAVNSDL